MNSPIRRAHKRRRMRRLRRRGHHVEDRDPTGPLWRAEIAQLVPSSEECVAKDLGVSFVIRASGLEREESLEECHPARVLPVRALRFQQRAKEKQGAETRGCTRTRIPIPCLSLLALGCLATLEAAPLNRVSFWPKEK